MAGKMSTFISSNERTPSTSIKRAITATEIGRRNARRTSHIIKQILRGLDCGPGGGIHIDAICPRDFGQPSPSDFAIEPLLGLEAEEDHTFTDTSLACNCVAAISPEVPRHGAQRKVP